MITCKEDLINTYIKNDFGELRDAYTNKATEFGFKLDWISHSPYGPSNNIIAICCWNGEETPFAGQTKDLPISTVSTSDLKRLTLSDLKPRTRTEYEKVTESIFDLKDDFERGELYFDKDYCTGGIYASNEQYHKVRDMNDFNQAALNNNIYRKVEKPIEWWSDAAEHVKQFGHAEKVESNGKLIVEASMTRDQWCDFARILLEQDGE